MAPLNREQLAARVSKAIDAAGLKQVEVALACRIDPTALSKALHGQRNFKTLEIALIAKTLGVSVEDLISDTPPGPSAGIAARARDIQDQGATEAQELVEHVLELDSLLQRRGYPASARLAVGAFSDRPPYSQGHELAIELRSIVGIEDEFPPDLEDLFVLLEDRLGVDIFVRPLPQGLDGLCVSRDGLRLILLSSSVSATRQRFTLAHEIGHLYAGDCEGVLVDRDISDSKTPRETRANAFAAAFLMPEEAMRNHCADISPLTEELIGTLLGRYRVSVDALSFRLSDLDIISRDERDQIRRMSSKKIALRSGRLADLQARNEVRAPGNLLARAVDAFTEGRISVRPLASLLGVPPDQLLDELSPSRTANGPVNDHSVPMP